MIAWTRFICSDDLPGEWRFLDMASDLEAAVWHNASGERIVQLVGKRPSVADYDGFVAWLEGE